METSTHLGPRHHLLLLECNGTISADCILLLLDSSHPLVSVCRIAGITAGSTMKDIRVQEDTGHHVIQLVSTGPAPGLPVAPSGQTGAPDCPLRPRICLVASSRAAECLQVGPSGPSASSRQHLQAQLLNLPHSNLCGLGSCPAPDGLCMPERSDHRLRLSSTTWLMPHAGLSGLTFCPPRVTIGPRCSRVGFSRPGSRLLLLASAGSSIGF
ncbi:uncharacterized protein LOC118152377 [Callithrix jacchus]